MTKTYNQKSDTHHRAEETVLAVLPRSVNMRVAETDAGSDLIVNGQPLRIEWVGEGTLGNVRRLLADPRSHPDIVVARRLSPGGRDALSQAGIGWADETGAAEIAVGSIVVSRTGRPPKAAERPAGWTPAVMAVAEALLCGTRATVSATETATGLSTGSCTHALRVLTKLGLLKSTAQRGRNSARRVSDPDRLLAAYAAAVETLPSPVSLQVGVTWRDPVAGLVETGKKWNEAKVAWAATGAVAASVIAPYLSTVTSAEVYVDADSIVRLEAVAADAGLRPIEGGRLTLKPFPTVAIPRLAKILNQLQVAPWPRIYADLHASGVRGEEAAEHLREVLHA